MTMDTEIAPSALPGLAAVFSASAALAACGGGAGSGGDIAAVKAKGYSAGLDEQCASPRSTPWHFDWMLAKGYPMGPQLRRQLGH